MRNCKLSITLSQEMLEYIEKDIKSMEYPIKKSKWIANAIEYYKNNSKTKKIIELDI